MGKILNFTLGDPLAIQQSWVFNGVACGRLPEEYNLPIVCQATLSARQSPNASAYPLGAGDEWELLRPCCPLDADVTNGAANRYYTEYSCISKYCATSNQTLAEGWEDCVKAAVQSSSAAARNNSDPITVNSRCEWVDYALVKKGRDAEGQAASWQAANLKGMQLHVADGDEPARGGALRSDHELALFKLD